MPKPSWEYAAVSLEARAGIEPAYTDLQSAASPLRHRAPLKAETAAGSVPLDQSDPLGNHRACFRDGSAPQKSFHKPRLPVYGSRQQAIATAQGATGSQMTDLNFASMRRAMVESQLRTNDVNDLHVIRAILSVPREQFVPAERRDAAYIDRSVPLGGGRALNPPLATARLLVEAAIAPGQRVLLIGAATGYAAALLAQLGAEVTAVESDEALIAIARERLADRPTVRLVAGELTEGAPDAAPYDCLFIDGAIEDMPDSLVAQLAPGGRAVFARIDRGVTRLCAGVRTEGGFGATSLVDSEAVVLPGFAKPRGFRF